MPFAFLGIPSIHALGQASLDGLITGGRYAILAVGIALILGVTGRFHFAYASSFTLAAYVTSVLVGSSGVIWPLAWLVGILAATALGVAVEAGIYRPLELRARGDATLAIFVASLGVTIVVQNMIQLVWSSNSRSLSAIPQHPVRFLGLTMSTVDVCIIAVAVAVALSVHVLLARTSLGRQIKAVRVNPELSSTVGVRPRRIFLIVFAIGSAIAGIAGPLDGMKFAVVPDMGTAPLLYGMVVAFLVGTRADPMRVAVGGFVVGLIQELSTLWVSEEISVIAVFTVLVIVLSYKSLQIAFSHHSESPWHALRRRMLGRRAYAPERT